jgi:hypothetical protein
MGFVSAEGLKNSETHHFVAGKYTWLDNRMNKFWYWVVDFLPLVKDCLIVIANSGWHLI